MVAVERVRFTKERETLLATLYARALDAGSRRAVLGDPYAAEAVRHIEYDFRKTGIRPARAGSLMLRVAQLDRWTRDFLAAHPEAVVLHLGCGLDTRVHRIDPGAGVSWYDVDYPDVIELRRRLLPERDAYQMIGASVTDEGWLSSIPGDRPVFVVTEGLTMYLTEDQGARLLRRITDHFSHGEVAFDVFSRFAIRSQKINHVVRRAGATLHWGIDDPRELERMNPRLNSVEVRTYADAEGIDRLPAPQRVILRGFLRVPSFRKMSVLLRYRF
ncbi:MAG: class I SAM-dependent methyltransferase [Streptosporangiales bacterium]|nr:class I SAM-dependent methyltransferase [Streptosporangiales bacterium]